MRTTIELRPIIYFTHTQVWLPYCRKYYLNGHNLAYLSPSYYLNGLTVGSM